MQTDTINGFMMSTLTFKIIPHGTSDYFVAVALRDDILRKPLGLAFSPQDLDWEKDHIHIGGYRDDEMVGSAMLVAGDRACKIQRVAVKADLQGSGIGSHMMSFCEDHAKELGFASVYCHARESAVPFYRRNGYEADGDYFIEINIPHLKMRKSI